MALPALRSKNTPDRWEPFREFEDLYSQMGQWMDSAFGDGDGFLSGWSPLADLTESDDAYLVEVDLPGVKRDDINLELHGSELVVSGEVKEKEAKGERRHRSRRTGQFGYRVTLPEPVDEDKVEASLDDGVLSIRLPKTEAVKARHIEITTH